MLVSYCKISFFFFLLVFVLHIRPSPRENFPLLTPYPRQSRKSSCRNFSFTKRPLISIFCKKKEARKKRKEDHKSTCSVISSPLNLNERGEDLRRRPGEKPAARLFIVPCGYLMPVLPITPIPSPSRYRARKGLESCFAITQAVASRCDYLKKCLKRVCRVIIIKL